MFFKLYTFLYIYFLKFFYFKRVFITGKISANGFFTIEVARNAKLIIDGNLTIKSRVSFAVRKNATLKIGSNCFFNKNCSIVAREQIIIEDDCLFGESVKIYDNDHKYENNKVSRTAYNTKKITIEKGSWVANDTNILKGSYIKENSVIAAMSLVNKELDKTGVYAGIPVKLIK